MKRFGNIRGGRRAGNRWYEKEFYRECDRILRTSNNKAERKSAMLSLNIIPPSDSDPYWDKYE